LRRDAATGVSLEALLASGLKHPSVVATHAWAVVTGNGQLPARVQVWGHTLDSSKPNIPLNRNSAPLPQQQQQQQRRRRRRKPDLAPSSAEPLYAKGNSSSSSSSSSAAFEADALAAAGGVVGTGDDSSDESSEEEHESSSSSGGADLAQLIGAGQTWLIMEFCDKGCLQVWGSACVEGVGGGRGVGHEERREGRECCRLLLAVMYAGLPVAPELARWARPG
jgi:hypothetical protein